MTNFIIKNMRIGNWWVFWSVSHCFTQEYSNPVEKYYKSSPNRHNNVSDKKNKSWYVTICLFADEMYQFLSFPENMALLRTRSSNFAIMFIRKLENFAKISVLKPLVFSEKYQFIHSQAPKFGSPGCTYPPEKKNWVPSRVPSPSWDPQIQATNKSLYVMRSSKMSRKFWFLFFCIFC